MHCPESCWETWTEVEQGRQITYVARTCEHPRADAEEAAASPPERLTLTEVYGRNPPQYGPGNPDFRWARY